MMADDNTSGAALAATPVTPPALAATITSPDALAAEGNTTDQPISLEDARKLRSEAQALRKRLKAYEDQEEQAKLSALSEVDKAQKQLVQAEAKIKKQQQELVNAQVRLAAKDKGIIDPDMAALALHDKLEFDDDGMPSNLDKALDDLIKAKPYLVPRSDETPPASPAQTAQQRQAPPLPGMNPGPVGRTGIASPVQNTLNTKDPLNTPGLWKT